MQNDRLKAKELQNSGNDEKALLIYEKLWIKDINNNKIDKWLGWEYAFTLKKIGKIDDAISVCKKVYIITKKFKYINDLLSWCLYEKYFKNIKGDKRPNNFGQIISIAKFIINITQQDDNLPYEKVVWKMIKLYKKPFKAYEINIWLNKLNVDLLSNVPIQIKNNNRIINLASPKESWYYLKSKSLIKLKKYKECNELCDVALNTIKSFHNNYDIWIKRNKAECMAILGNKEEAIKVLKSILTKNKHWSIYQLIFEIEVDMKEYNEGLLYAYFAASTNDPPEKKINLYFLIGNVLQNMGHNKAALMHYLLSKNIREKKKWNVPKSLNDSIANLSKIEKVNNDKLYSRLKEYWAEEKIKLEKRYDGYIINILPNGKAGFIKCCNQNYYFRTSSFNGNKNKLIKNIAVTFSLINSFDRRKQTNSKEAIDVNLK